jgi:outer membrane protein OmpA-like peptidoglycan-associated protein
LKKLFLIGLGFIGLTGCAELGGNFSSDNTAENMPVVPTPTVDYIKNVDPYSAEGKDPFLIQLTMNYRSYAIYNATISGYPEIGEMFAQKSVAAFSGENPAPEILDNWVVQDAKEAIELRDGYRELTTALQNDVALEKPKLTAEAQAKFDCWLSSAASGQTGTATECRQRFMNTMIAIKGNGGDVSDEVPQRNLLAEAAAQNSGFEDAAAQPNTAELGLLTNTKRTREGVVIVNNINVPSELIRPAPVHPVVINQNIYSNGRVVGPDGEQIVGDESVSRDEFINMMMAIRSEIQEINNKIGKTNSSSNDTMTLKIQQIPTEPKQRLMEEIFEVHFDFNKATVKPEYAEVVQKLAETARANNNVKISVVGHTDTVGSNSYNYALGGRRAESVKQMLVQQGVPATSIIIVSSGKNDLKVPTGDNVKNPENRRVRVVKETRYTEMPKPEPVATDDSNSEMPEPVATDDSDFGDLNK